MQQSRGAHPSQSLTGRVALVTGGSRGIGRAIVHELARHGARVAVGARDAEAVAEVVAEIEAHGGKALALAGDLARSETSERWLTATQDALGTIAILVNNAGHTGSAKLEATTDQELDRQLELQAKAPFRLCRGVLPAMRKAGFGRIVNVASTAGLTGFPYVAAYVTAKHALVGLTRALAAELAGTGITANAVCPGFVDTELTRAAAKTMAQRQGCSEAEALQRLAALNRGGKLVQPTEVARAVAYLAGDGLPSQNGVCLVLDGGTVLT